MFLPKIKHTLTRNLSNLPGWRTNRKIVVIESDDWGSIRMPSLSTFKDLSVAGIDLISQNAERYNKNDSLATEEDLKSLFECLKSFSDINGNCPVFTAVSVVANPDFDRIKESGFMRYYYEPFTETLKKYYGSDRSFSMWKEGIKQNIFLPQFHGREHLNVTAWLKALRGGEEKALTAFEHEFWSIVRPHGTVSFQAAFDLTEIDEITYLESVLIEGLDLFENIFGYRASYFVPPNGPINNQLNGIAYKKGIKFRSTARMQMEPLGSAKYRRVGHYIGQKSLSGITYLTRNAFFEPSDRTKNWVSSCLSDIEIAFRWLKPAIISSHRVNYIGALDPNNRTNGLSQLNILLKKIIDKWPEVEFMTSDVLGDLIVAEKTK